MSGGTFALLQKKRMKDSQLRELRVNTCCLVMSSSVVDIHEYTCCLGGKIAQTAHFGWFRWNFRQPGNYISTGINRSMLSFHWPKMRLGLLIVSQWESSAFLSNIKYDSDATWKLWMTAVHSRLTHDIGTWPKFLTKSHCWVVTNPNQLIMAIGAFVLTQKSVLWRRLSATFWLLFHQNKQCQYKRRLTRYLSGRRSQLATTSYQI